jgi:hypothetical protein
VPFFGRLKRERANHKKVLALVVMIDDEKIVRNDRLMKKKKEDTKDWGETQSLFLF